MAAADILTFIAPEFATLSQALIDQALLMAEAYRPWCLDQPQGDEAVALYAAWLLTERASAIGGSSSQSTTVATGALIREREGDRERAWASPSTTTTTTTSTASPLTGYKARYDALARMCGYGAILTRDIPPGAVPWGVDGETWP